MIEKLVTVIILYLYAVIKLNWENKFNKRWINKKPNVSQLSWKKKLELKIKNYLIRSILFGHQLINLLVLVIKENFLYFLDQYIYLTMHINICITYIITNIFHV